MALATKASIALPAIRASPTTIQYAVPRKSPHARPKYARKFYPSDEAKATLSQPWLARTDPLMPPYPYGKNAHFEEANHGLYGGATIQSGHKISKGRNKGKTLRKWYPNVRVERIKSVALGQEMHLPVAARTMRTIQKCGGLDEYLLGEKPARIKELGLLGWKLRWLVLKSKAMQARHKKERASLGLPDSEINPYSVTSTFEEAWKDETTRSTILQQMMQNWEALQDRHKTWQRHVLSTLGNVRGPRRHASKELLSLEMHEPSKMGLEHLSVGEAQPEMDVVEEEPVPGEKEAKQKHREKKGS